MENKNRIPLILAIAIVVLGIGGAIWWGMSSGTPEGFGQKTETTTGTELPKDAKPLDDWAYVNAEGVYLKSVRGGTAVLTIPNADPETFERLTEFKTSPDPAIVRDCGAPGRFTLYKDKKALYFYQVWVTPTFSSSKIEVVKGPNTAALQFTGDTAFTDGAVNYSVGYTTASSTCEYVIR